MALVWLDFCFELRKIQYCHRLAYHCLQNGIPKWQMILGSKSEENIIYYFSLETRDPTETKLNFHRNKCYEFRIFHLNLISFCSFDIVGSESSRSTNSYLHSTVCCLCEMRYTVCVSAATLRSMSFFMELNSNETRVDEGRLHAVFSTTEFIVEKKVFKKWIAIEFHFSSGTDNSRCKMKLLFCTQNHSSNCAISVLVSTSVWVFDLSSHYLRRFCAMGTADIVA